MVEEVQPFGEPWMEDNVLGMSVWHVCYELIGCGHHQQHIAACALTKPSKACGTVVQEQLRAVICRVHTSIWPSRSCPLHGGAGEPSQRSPTLASCTIRPAAHSGQLVRSCSNGTTRGLRFDNCTVTGRQRSRSDKHATAKESLRQEQRREGAARDAPKLFQS